MSNRAVRKLHGAKDDLSTLASNLDLLDKEEEAENVGAISKKKPVVNMFDLVYIICCCLCSIACYHCFLVYLQLNEGAGSDSGSPPPSPLQEEQEEDSPTTQVGTKPKNKSNKKKKKKKQPAEDKEELPDIDDMNDGDFPMWGTSSNGHAPSTCISRSFNNKDVLNLEQKNLNPDNELKKIFGSKVVTAGQKKKARGRAYVKSTWLISAKDNWSQMRKTGRYY